MEFKFPDVGEGIHEGVIVTWLKEPGDAIKEDEPICEVETDKAVVEIPSPAAGTLGKRFHEVGETVNVGEVLVEIITEEKIQTNQSETIQEEVKQEPADSGNVVGALVDADTIKDEILDLTSKPSKQQSNKIQALPYVRRMATDLDVDLNTIKGTGSNGEITIEDVKSSIGNISSNKDKKPSAEINTPQYGNEREEDLSQMRKAIAKNMMASKSASAQLTHFDEIYVDKLGEVRAQQKPLAEEKGIKLTYLPFIIEGVIKACEEFEIFNAAYDSQNQKLVVKEYYNIGIAVDTEGGLVVPVIKNAEKLSILGLAEAITDLATKAKDKKLKLEDMKDSTITITNYGSIGGKFATPILNYPNLVSIGLGRFEKKLELVEGIPTERTILPLSMTYDHQIIDGADAARFVNKVKEILENAA
jgi:pyruvate dehydrogenase E2 component (dihydrolipoamide acetyltransferase)